MKPEPDARDHTYRGETYYELPALKRSHWKNLVTAYFWIGGIAGGAQLLAQVADLAGRGTQRSVVRHGRYLALLGTLASPVLLIADLHAPRRWYNMLRIFRPTSAMNLGAWTLTLFGATSSAAAACQYMEDRTGSRRCRWLARLAGIPAAALGAVMSTYTGTLLAATSTPLWSAAGKLLPMLFGTSAMSTATAALLLAERDGQQRSSVASLQTIGLISGAAEAATAAALHRRWKEAGVEQPLHDPPCSHQYRLAHMLGIAAPLAIYGVQRWRKGHSRQATLCAAAAALAGGYLLRHVLVSAGNRSAEQPRDYFRLARGDSASDQPAAARLPARHRPPHHDQSRTLWQQFTGGQPATSAARPEPLVGLVPERLQAEIYERIQELEQLPARELREQLQHAQVLLVALRDHWINELREQPPPEHRQQASRTLQRINVALSLLVGVEFPQSGTQRELLRQARELLSDEG